MAMIFDAFMSQFASLLTQMVQQDMGMLLGVPGEIEKLQKTIGDIQCVLADADMKKIENRPIERWLMELKDAMYDADDIMDLCQIKVQERLERSNSPSSSKLGCGFLKPLSCFRNPVFAYKIGTKIREIKLRLEGIAKQKTDLGLIELQNAIGRPLVRRADMFVSRDTDTVVVLDDIVGETIEEDVRLLVSWLTENEEGGVRNKISVVAIVGMGGIGKTTLAKKIFNDPKMEEFQLKIWICVSKQKGIDVLKCVIRETGGDHGSRQERSELVDLLKSLVKEKKFLLVLDDVWPENIQFWDGLLRAPLMHGAHGSRLLVTTRDEGVANSMMATKSHRVGKLPDEDGLSLLFKQVFQNDEERDIQEFKSIGMQLVEKCDGLPLAMKSIAGVLRTKIRTVEEWEKVLKSNTWFMKGLQADVHRAFYLSYEDLPSHLKQCFISLSLFPEDCTFDSTLLTYFWLAEGYLQDNENLLELGQEYYRELLLRNLLEDSERYIDQAECRMHDLLWSFAGYLGRDENLVRREGDDILNQKSPSKLRRLSIQAHEAKHDFFMKEKWLRTIHIDDISESALRDLCGTLSNLRILALGSSNILTLPDSSIFQK